MTGQPAISVPAGLNNDMPVPIQMVGRYGDEATLLQVSAFLEQAQPWANFQPAVYAG
jgi:amidase